MSTATARMQDVVARLRPGMTVYVPGVSGESLAFHEALTQKPEAASGVRFVGVHFPGINRSDYIGLHPLTHQRSYFMQPSLRSAFGDGRAELVPLDYPGIWRDLEQLPIDIAIAQVSPADASGQCSLGLSCDFIPAIWKRAKLRVGHINPLLPRTAGSFTIAAGDFDLQVHTESPLVTLDSGKPNAAMQHHAALVSGLVRDGDTLQFGVGKLQSAILESLHQHRRLRVWSGMVSTPILGLLDSGAIAGKGAIESGVALGDASFYERLRHDESFYFRPVDETHDVRRIAAINSFCGINSAIEVDLLGQVNADSLGGKLVAGVGGLPAFISGARMSAGGRAIVALPSATDDGGISRIVPRIDNGGLVALPRHEADHIVTEHGVATLRSKSLHERAHALIAVAAPQFRESLAQAWDTIARKL